jgi:hypothetical protein
LDGEGFTQRYFGNILSHLNPLRPINPITTTFFISWLVSVIFLIVHYCRADLHPRDFLYASMRLLVAFLAGLLFANWFSTGSNDSEFSLWHLLPAIAVAMPLELVRAGWQRVRSQVDKLDDSWYKDLLLQFAVPTWGGKHPLTKLSKFKPWDDARFYVEGIQNVHALATANLESLVLDTTFDTEALIGWVDQALLYIHVKDVWWQRFTQLDKATATSLFKACVDSTSGKIDRDKVSQLVQMYNQDSDDNTARSNVTEQEAAQPALTTDILEIILTAMMRGPNIAHVRSLKRLN